MVWRSYRQIQNHTTHCGRQTRSRTDHVDPQVRTYALVPEGQIYHHTEWQYLDSKDGSLGAIDPFQGLQRRRDRTGRRAQDPARQTTKRRQTVALIDSQIRCRCLLRLVPRNVQPRLWTLRERLEDVVTS